MVVKLFPKGQQIIKKIKTLIMVKPIHYSLCSHSKNLTILLRKSIKFTENKKYTIFIPNV